jgi:preprotein translocase subunit SecE
MADDDNRDEQPNDSEAETEVSEGLVAPADDASTAAAEREREDAAAAALGATRYVHAAFFAGGILVAYLASRLVLSLWNNLAEWSVAVRYVPQLVALGDRERDTYALVAGAIIGIVTVVQTYRKPQVRQWADDVAMELAKVTWPNKETVSNGTVVVIVASAVATVYIALLDRFWGFLTTLVYGV